MDLASIIPGQRIVVLECSDPSWNFLTGTVDHVLQATGKAYIRMDSAPTGHTESWTPDYIFKCDPEMLWPIDHPKAQCPCGMFRKLCDYHRVVAEKTDPDPFKLDLG